MELREYFALLESIAQEFNKSALLAIELATKLQTTADADHKWRTWADNLCTTAEQLKGLEQMMRTRVQQLNRPFQVPGRQSYWPQ